jgi:hypothetical protein
MICCRETVTENVVSTTVQQKVRRREKESDRTGTTGKIAQIIQSWKHCAYHKVETNDAVAHAHIRVAHHMTIDSEETPEDGSEGEYAGD